jgi:hypothetical protein
LVCPLLLGVLTYSWINVIILEPCANAFKDQISKSENDGTSLP